MVKAAIMLLLALGTASAEPLETSAPIQTPDTPTRIIQLRETVNVMPSPLEAARAYAATGYGHWLKGEIPEAVAAYEQALAQNLPAGPDRSGIEQEYRELLTAAQDWPRLKAFLQQDGRYRKDSALALQLARAAMALGRPDEAGIALKALDASARRAHAGEILEIETLAAARAGRTAQAASLARRLLSKEPGKKAFYVLVGEDAARRGKTAMALTAFQKALHMPKEHPWRPRALLGAAEAALKLGKHREALDYQKQAMTEGALDEGTLLRTARMARQLKQDALATEAYEKLLEADPGHAEALFQTGYQAYQKGDALKARDRLGRFLAQVPDNAEARYYLAAMAYRQGAADTSQAETAYLQALQDMTRQEPKNTGYWRELATLHARRKDMPALAAAYDRLLALNPKDIETLSADGRLALEQGQHARAVERLSRALALQPRNAEALYDRGRAQQATGRNEAALQDYLQAVAVQPGLTDAHLRAGLMLARRKAAPGARDAAKKHLGTALGQNPALAEAALVLGKIHLDEENYAQAERHLANAYSLAPQQPGLAPVLANLYLQVGDTSRAIGLYKTLLRQNPDQPELLGNLGAAYLRGGEAKNAVVPLYRAAQLSPENPDRLNALGLAYLHSGMTADATEAFKKALTVADRIPYRYNLAEAYRHQGDRERAMAEYDRAVHAEATTPEAFFNKGRVFFQLGKYDDALRYYQRALGGMPDRLSRAQVHMALGLAHEALGDTPAARAAFGEVLKIVPEGQTAAAARTRLNALSAQH